jgi:solute carrier family 41
MIIPVILNLKGNLEMSLSARLSTAANIGELDNPKSRWEIIIGNLTLLQVQGTVVSFIAALVAFALSRMLPATELPTESAISMLSSRHILQQRRPRPLPTPKSTGGAAE